MSAPFLIDPTLQKPGNWARRVQENMMNVDDTSDANKPISDATQAALDTKADLNNPTFIDVIIKNEIILQNDVGQNQLHVTADSDKIITSSRVKHQMILSDTPQIGAYVILQGGMDVIRYNTLDNIIEHGTNRQVNSQPIAVASYLGTSGNYTVDANNRTSVYTCNTAFDSNTFNIDIDNCYEGKVLRFVASGGTGKIKISPESSPGVAVFLYEGTGGGAVTVFEAGTGQGYDVLFAVVAGQLIGRVTV